MRQSYVLLGAGVACAVREYGAREVQLVPVRGSVSVGHVLGCSLSAEQRCALPGILLVWLGQIWWCAVGLVQHLS